MVIGVLEVMCVLVVMCAGGGDMWAYSHVLTVMCPCGDVC